MITAAVALLTSLIGPLVAGGTLGTIFAFLSTPGAAVAKTVLVQVLKAAAKPLTEEQKRRLAAYHAEMRSRPFH